LEVFHNVPAILDEQGFGSHISSNTWIMVIRLFNCLARSKRLVAGFLLLEQRERHPYLFAINSTSWVCEFQAKAITSATFC
jgi:hypothetical protein